MRNRIAAAVLLFAVSAAHAADPLPTPEELQKLQDDKKWPELSSATARILALKGPVTDAYVRFDVWMKKAEAQLQSNQIAPAQQSFSKAAEEPKATPDQVDDAKAMALLVKRSDIKGYKTPGRAGPIQSFDIRDPQKRVNALAALFGVEYGDVKKRVDNSRGVTDARPLTEIAKAVSDLRSLDRVVNKSNDKSDELEKTLGENVAASAKKWSDTTIKSLDDMKKTADEIITERYRDAQNRQVTNTHRRGYTADNLTTSINYMNAAKKWAETYKTVQPLLGPTGQGAIQPAEAMIQTTFDRAKSVQQDAMQQRANGT
ncbi:MAG: hypothetical protein QM754_05660 [Tepidisphaeraceae bacterium]